MKRITSSPRRHITAAPKSKNTSAQRGNVLWLILIAVALLAALSITLSRSGSNVEQSGSFEQLRVKATQILRYASGIERGIERMLTVNGCSENEISFENAITADYINADSPADQSCHVFEAQGAGLQWRDLTQLTLSTFGGDNMGISAEITINNIEDNSRSELLLFIPVSQPLCAHINASFDISSDPADITSNINSFTKFIGAFPQTFNLGTASATTAPDLNRQPTGCFIDDTGAFVFYHTLIAR